MAPSTESVTAGRQVGELRPVSGELRHVRSGGKIERSTFAGKLKHKSRSMKRLYISV